MPAKSSAKNVFEEKLSAIGIDASYARLQSVVSRHGNASALWIALSKDKAVATLAMEYLIRSLAGFIVQGGPSRPQAISWSKPTPEDRARNVEQTKAAALKLVVAREVVIKKSIKDKLCWSDGSLVAKTTIGGLLARIRDGEYDASLATQLWTKLKGHSDKRRPIAGFISGATLEEMHKAATEAARGVLDGVVRT